MSKLPTKDRQKRWQTHKGSSWSTGVQVWKGPSAYSQLVSLGTTDTVGLLFEAGVKTAYETISFVEVKV